MLLTKENIYEHVVVADNSCWMWIHYEHVWYAPTLDEANKFAQSIADQTQSEVDVCKLIGSWRPKPLPVEFVSATDVTPDLPPPAVQPNEA